MTAPLRPLANATALSWRGDARLPLLSGLAALVALAASSTVTLSAVVLAGCAAVCAKTRLPFRSVARRLAMPLLAACLLAATPVALRLASGVPREAGVWIMAAAPQAVAGARLACRVLASMSVIIVVSGLAAPYDILAALRWMRISRTWIGLAMLMQRYGFSLLETARTIRDAQRVRLGYAGFGRALRSTGSLAGILLVEAIEQADRTYDAMRARGSCGTLEVAPLAPLGAARAGALILGMVLLLAVFLATERWCP